MLCDLYTNRDGAGRTRQRWYHILMAKLFCSLAVVVGSLVAAVNPQLRQVNTVYILSMNRGIDQFLANQLTTQGVFQVVTDPQKADAILTDRLGEGFESKLKELYPPPAPPAPPKKESAAEKEKKDDGTDFGSAGPRPASTGRGKGNFFIVDRRTQAVLWSVYEEPRDSTPSELTKIAARVVKKLKEDLAGKKAD